MIFRIFFSFFLSVSVETMTSKLFTCRNQKSLAFLLALKVLKSLILYCSLMHLYLLSTTLPFLPLHSTLTICHPDLALYSCWAHLSNWQERGGEIWEKAGNTMLHEGLLYSLFFRMHIFCHFNSFHSTQRILNFCLS